MSCSIPSYPLPLTSNDMRGLKAAKEEEDRKKKEEMRKYNVYRSVMCFYGGAHDTAVSGGQQYSGALKTNEFDIEVISDLRSLFPGCSVEFTVKRNGCMIVVTDKDFTLVKPEFIVIDWSK